MNSERNNTKNSLKKITAISAILAAVAAFGLISLLYFKNIQLSKEKARLIQEQNRGRPVEVAKVQRSSGKSHIILLGECRPYYSVTLYSRISGYLKQNFADIGDDVKEGQILAYIQSPESEQAYNSARADAINRRRIANRTRILLKKKLVSQQEADQAFSAAEIAESTLATQKTIRDYQNILAPFNGRIVERFLDPGALIQNASNSHSASQPLFTISKIDRLRVFFYIDQSNAGFVHTGDPVKIFLPSQSEVELTANITQTAGQLDSRTRTLLAEVQIDNHELRIVPGSFLKIILTITIPTYLELPAQALVIQNGKAFVPLVGEHQKIHYSQVEIAESDGKRIYVKSGIQEGELVAINIGNSLQEGAKVRVIMSEMAGKAEIESQRDSIASSQGS